MRRISLWVLSTLSMLVLLFGYSTSTSGPLATSPSTSIESGPAISSSSASGATGSTSGSPPSGSPPSGSTPSGSTSGASAAKTVTGSVAQTRWGPVQVQLSVSAGKITKVAVVQYPNGNGKDQEINSYALPILTKETVDSQTASIDMVSGATVTSDGYLQSLQSAIDQAGL
jgi:uncharacterized protein with FMN-binding domain